MLLQSTLSAKDGYNVAVQFEDVQNEKIYLCHYFGKGSTVYKDDSLTLDAAGKGTFRSSEAIVGGVYLILFEDRSATLEFILLNGNSFSLFSKKADVRNTKFKGNSENKQYYQYQEFLNSFGGEYEKIMNSYSTAKSREDSAVIDLAAKTKVKDLTNYRNKFAERNPKLFMSKMFKAIGEPQIPKELPILPDGSKDSSFPAEYYKAHYWDDYDFRDDRLIYTPIYEGKLKNYMDRWVLPIADSVKDASDMILKKSMGSPETFKYSLWYLSRWTEQSKIMGMDEAFVHLVENYYMRGLATWIDSAQLAKYVERAKKIAPNMIGQQAIDIRMPEMKTGTIIPLSTVEAEYTLLIFWSPDCGHCKKEIPRVDSIVRNELKNIDIKIYGVNAENEYEKQWEKLVDDLNFKENWIHVHDPKHQSPFRNFYDVYSTPTIYLLDKDKKIVGKKLDHKNLKGLVDYLEKKKKEKN